MSHNVKTFISLKVLVLIGGKLDLYIHCTFHNAHFLFITIGRYSSISIAADGYPELGRDDYIKALEQMEEFSEEGDYQQLY